MLSGLAAMLIGMVIIVLLEVPIWWRWIIGVLWLADCLSGLRNLAQGAQWAHQIALDSSGGVDVLTAGGRTERAELRSGTVVLSNFAWLRIGTCRGRQYSGLFIRKRTSPADWHNLQLLWRQSREAFGHLG